MADYDASAPAELNLKAAEVIASAATPVPEPPDPVDTIVPLPGGLVRGDAVIKEVEVRELTGVDEEKISKAARTANAFRLIDTLMECGIVRIGSEDELNTKRLRGELLLGDRDQVLLGIRKATYGSEVKIPGWTCPNCQVESDLTFNLDEDIAVRKMDDVRTQAEFSVDLRKGKKAKVRLVNGNDQLDVFSEDGLTPAERDTKLLQRCVLSVIDTKGQEQMMSMYPQMALALGMADRHTILNALLDKQPGPQLDDLKIVHDSCGKEVPVGAGIISLFRDIF